MAATVLLGSLLYRPWVLAPFDLLDFSEFIPRLKSASSPWDGFMQLSRYYLGHGRISPVAYATIVMKWWAFGDWTPGWQCLRVVLVALIVRSAFALYLKLGATRTGAALGGAAFLVAPTASPIWIRLSVGEPLGVLFVLWASNIAVDARHGTATRTRALQLAALAILLGLTKEMMLVCLALPAVLYLWPGNGESFWRRSRFLVPTIVATALVSAFLLWGYLQTTSVGYAAEYGTTHAALWEVLPPWLFSFFPYDPFSGGSPALFVIITLGWLCLLALGWSLYLRTASPEARRQATLFLGLALVFPGLLALEYLPWPVFNRFYYFPAVASLGGLAAIATSGLERTTSRAGFTVAMLALGASYATGGLQARGASDRSFAARLAIGELVQYLGKASPVDTLLIGARIVANQKWQGLPETIHRYGPVVGVALPPTVGTSCDEGAAAARDAMRNIAFVSFATACRAPDVADRTVHRSYRRFDFSTLRVVPDSVRIDVSLSKRSGG